jgi:CheY-like chemotaxis protein
MEITCDSCSAKLNLPDEKIPKDQIVRISCPKCKNKIRLDPRKTADTEPSPTEPPEHDDTGKFRLKFIESQRPSEPEEEGYNYDDYTDDEALEFFEEDAKLSLVMSSDDEQAEMIKKSVEELGYKYITASDTRDALGKMRFHHFELVVLCDGFDEQNLEQNAITRYLNTLSMSVRRRILVALMGEQFRSLDDTMAFAVSANAVINIKDLEKLTPMLRKAISDHDKFYRVYMEAMGELGKV